MFLRGKLWYSLCLMNFADKLQTAAKNNQSLVCVGLDPDLDKISPQSQFEFNKAIIDQTHDLVCAFKPNSAFYEADGIDGIVALKETCDYINQNYPEIPIILDAKRGDIGNTNRGYAKLAFEYLKADAITLNPYMGVEALGAFAEYSDKGLIILARTSNAGGDDFQNNPSEAPLYLSVVEEFQKQWPDHSGLMFVAGATHPDELAKIRAAAGDSWLLVPGVGAQGGDIAKVMSCGVNSSGGGLAINASRSIIFAESPRRAAQELKDAIEKERPQ